MRKLLKSFSRNRCIYWFERFATKIVTRVLRL